MFSKIVGNMFAKESTAEEWREQRDYLQSHNLTALADKCEK